MDGVPTYSLSELAQLADVTPRTIRFYIAQGLLPAPDAQGPSTRYTDAHLARLRAIRKLQGTHLPLAEIRQRLATVSPEYLVELAEAQAPASDRGDALEYIREVIASPRAAYPAAMPAAVPAPAAPVPATQAPLPGPKPPEPSRSQWERIPLDPDIELHVRRPLTRNQNKRVERLIAIARELFEED